MSNQIPTVGRIVHYRPTDFDPEKDQPQAAIVTYVWNPTLVNLAVFDSNGNPYPLTSVCQGDQPAYWDWPPKV